MLLLRNPRGTCVCGRKNDWLHIRQHVGILGGVGSPLSLVFSFSVCVAFLLLVTLLVHVLVLRRQTRRQEEDQEEEEEEGKHLNLLL